MSSPKSIYDRTVGPMASRLFSMLDISGSPKKKVQRGGATSLDYGMLTRTKDLITPKDVFDVHVDPRVTGFTSALDAVSSYTKVIDDRTLADLGTYGGGNRPGGGKKKPAAKKAAPAKTKAKKPATAAAAPKKKRVAK